MSESCGWAHLIAAYSNGELLPEDAHAFEEHLESCAECARALRAFATLEQALRSDHPSRRRSRDCPDDETLAAYADGSLDEGARAGVEEHLAICAGCLHEVAWLWSVEGEADRDAGDASVRRVTERLRGQLRTAVLRWAGDTLSVVSGFAGFLEDLGEDAGVLDPAVAAVRATAPAARLAWAGERGLVLRCSIDLRSGDPALLGRFSGERGDLARISVALEGMGGARGPESLDAAGRFGPWPLGVGRNVLRLSGGGVGPEPVELLIEVEREDAEGG